DTGDYPDYTSFGYIRDGLLGVTTASAALTSMQNRLTTVCNNMKAAGIIIYTIGLGDGATNTQLQSCAGPSPGAFYAAPTAADLTQAVERDGDLLEGRRQIGRSRRRVERSRRGPGAALKLRIGGAIAESDGVDDDAGRLHVVADGGQPVLHRGERSARRGDAEETVADVAKARVIRIVAGVVVAIGLEHHRLDQARRAIGLAVREGRIGRQRSPAPDHADVDRSAAIGARRHTGRGVVELRLIVGEPHHGHGTTEVRPIGLVVGA